MGRSDRKRYGPPLKVRTRRTADYRPLRAISSQRGRDELVDRPRALVAAGAAAHRHGALLDLAVADHEHVGHLLQLRLADLVADLLLPLVEFDPQPGRRQPVAHRRPRTPGAGRRSAARSPARGASHSGKRARVVLDQQRDEALEAAEDRAVDDDRAVLGVVGADVLQVEPLRQLVVELDRGALPLPPDRVGDVEVDLRPVERAVALVDRVGLARRSRAPASAAPRRGPTSAISPRYSLGPRRELRRGREAEVAVDPLDEPQQPLDFLADLLLGHEAVRVVLRELRARASGPTARPTPRCGAATSARGTGAAGRGSCAPRCRTRACGPGSSSASGRSLLARPRRGTCSRGSAASARTSPTAPC